MSVKANRLTATVDVDRIVQGEALTITVELADEVSGQAFELADLEEATATFPGVILDDGTSTPVEVEATANGDPGRLSVPLTVDDTAAMRAGTEQSWQLSITLTGGTVRIVQVCQQLDVVASLF